MDTRLLGSLSALLRTLATGPHPDVVASTMAESLRDPFGTASASILAIRGHRLIILGLHGYEQPEIRALRAMPLDGDYPLTRSIREGEVIIHANVDVATGYAGTRRAGGSWAGISERLPGGTTACVPITSAGRAVGAYAITCAGVREWTPLDVAALEGVGHALGMWLTHPDSGLPATEPVDPPELTGRQIAILALVAEARSNTEIANQLGFSDSTVKQEMQRILRSLDVDDRREAAARATALGLIPVGSE